jgi:hypothetical protein
VRVSGFSRQESLGHQDRFVACAFGYVRDSNGSRIYAWEGLGPDVELTGTTEERLPGRALLERTATDPRVVAAGRVSNERSKTDSRKSVRAMISEGFLDEL